VRRTVRIEGEFPELAEDAAGEPCGQRLIAGILARPGGVTARPVRLGMNDSAVLCTNVYLDPSSGASHWSLAARPEVKPFATSSP
jgi:hypothetical protein